LNNENWREEKKREEQSFHYVGPEDRIKNWKGTKEYYPTSKIYSRKSQGNNAEHGGDQLRGRKSMLRREDKNSYQILLVSMVKKQRSVGRGGSSEVQKRVCGKNTTHRGRPSEGDLDREKRWGLNRPGTKLFSPTIVSSEKRWAREKST